MALRNILSWCPRLHRLPMISRGKSFTDPNPRHSILVQRSHSLAGLRREQRAPSCCKVPLASLARTEGSFLLGWSDPTFVYGSVPKVNRGSLQPNTVPFRGHSAHSVVRNSLLPGHLLVLQGEREGDGQREQALSCTVHLHAVQITIEAL